MDLPPYAHAGARACVVLHERELRAFLRTWRRFDASGASLPPTRDPAYASNTALLFHILGAARGYLVWMCEMLGLADPGIEPQPPVDRLPAGLDAWADHLLSRWRVALARVPEERFEPEVHPARWGPPYTIDAMLEHAVMHPIRHRYQLERLLGEAD